MPGIVTCKNCGKETYAAQPQCFHCGAVGYEEKNPEGHRLAPGHQSAPDPDEDNFDINFDISKEQEAQFSITGNWLHIDLETAKHHPLFGTFGWLGFFQIMLYIGPVLGLVYGLIVAANVSSRYTSSFLFILIVDLCFLVWAWWLATQLRKPQPQSTRYVYIYIIAAVAIGFVTVIITASLSNYSPHRMGNVLAAHLIKNTIVAVVWAFYFTVSKRVNVTYRHRVKLGDPFVKTLGINLSAIPHDKTWSQKASTHAAELVHTARDTVTPHVEGAMKVAAKGVANTVSSLQQQEPIAADNFSSRLTALKKALDEGLITEGDYEKKKKTILNDL